MHQPVAPVKDFFQQHSLTTPQHYAPVPCALTHQQGQELFANFLRLEDKTKK
jgi:hypothetical protein